VSAVNSSGGQDSGCFDIHTSGSSKAVHYSQVSRTPIPCHVLLTTIKSFRSLALGHWKVPKLSTKGVLVSNWVLIGVRIPQTSNSPRISLPVSILWLLVTGDRGLYGKPAHGSRLRRDSTSSFSPLDNPAVHAVWWSLSCVAR